MSRKFLVFFGGALLVGLVVAMVQAQETFRRTTEPARGAASLADRLQAARKSPVIEDEMVAPAGANDFPASSRKAVRTPVGRPPAGAVLTTPGGGAITDDAAEPSAFAPEAGADLLGVGAPADPRGDEPAVENLPSVLKRGQPPVNTGGEFIAPMPVSAPVGTSGLKKPAAGFPTYVAPPATPAISAPAVRTADAASSRRTVRVPQDSAGRPLGSSTASPSERGTLASSQSPAIRIDTIGPAAMKIGKEAIYTVQAINLGDAEAREVVVTVDLPEWITVTGNDAGTGVARRKGSDAGSQLAWELDRLPARGQAQLNLKLVVQENRPFELGVDWTCSHARAAARIEVQEPQLSMSLTGPKEMLFGETAVYTITLSNPGTGDAENVHVSLLPPPGSTRAKESSRVGTVAAGQQKQIEIELSAREAGTMEVRVGAEADGGLHGEAAASVLVRRANLELALEGPKLKYAGSVGVFRARLANNGNAPAEDLVAAISLPVGAKYLGGADGLKPVAGGLAWPVGRLAPGAERVLEFKCEFTSAGDSRVEVKAKGAAELFASADFTTTVEALAELKLSVVEPKGPKPVGEDAVYELKIQNRGTKAARQVSVVAQFSEGIEPLTADGARADVVPGQVIYQPLPRIDAGEEVTLRITARADKEGNHIFRAEIKCSDPETRLVHEGTTRYFAGDAPARTVKSNNATAPALKKASRPDTLQLR